MAVGWDFRAMPLGLSSTGTELLEPKWLEADGVKGGWDDGGWGGILIFLIGMDWRTGSIDGVP